jgi:hypothetical protein
MFRWSRVSTQTVSTAYNYTLRMLQTSTVNKITAHNVNPLLSEVQYAVRGEIVVRAGEYEKQLKVEHLLRLSIQVFLYSTNF